MSAFGGKADTDRMPRDVRFRPKADIRDTPGYLHEPGAIYLGYDAAACFPFGDRNQTAGRHSPAASSFKAEDRIAQSVGPALLAFRAKMVSGRAGASHRHRMAVAFGTAPPSGAASFRDLDDQAVVSSDRNWGESSGAGGCHNTKYERGAQHNWSHHSMFLPDCWCHLHGIGGVPIKQSTQWTMAERCWACLSPLLARRVISRQYSFFRGSFRG